MFCYQCEQSAKGGGCTTHGVCGKNPQTSDLQDLLIHALTGLSMVAHRARQLGIADREADAFTTAALFATLTNVNFDPERIAAYIAQACEHRDRLQARVDETARAAGEAPSAPTGPAAFTPTADLAGLTEQAQAASILVRKERLGDDLVGLQELLTYGLKGMAAYLCHAQALGFEDDDLYAFTHEALALLSRPEGGTVDELLGWCLRCGEMNLRAMELLDTAHVSRFGDPEPTSVRIEPVKGKAILVSGHDLLDLEDILKQTAGKGINVYTHGEMLPAHGYPGLKKHQHLVGNYGGAWQSQRREFEQFPGAILMTTNCLQAPKESYRARIFTTSVVGWPGVAHISGRDFSPLIKAAKEADGFAEDGSDRRLLVGFGRNALLGAADRVIALVKKGAIRYFFLVGGCDGAKPGRNYYTEFAQSAPADSVILTLACGKYRFNELDFGAIDGIPRLLDIGQCNDAYSAIKIAQALADAFETDVNGLPLSLVLSWFEQKAVAILLTLLHLGVRNMRLGPTMPAFLTPNLGQALQEKFNIMPITTAQADLEAILSPQ